MYKLTYPQLCELTERFPLFELSYETISHKKVSDSYNVTMAIPFGKKAFVWFTYYKNKNVCFLMELGKEKKIINATIINDNVPIDLAYGTICYGCIYEIPDVRSFFIIEDIVYSKGICIMKQPFVEKFHFLQNLLEKYTLFLKDNTFPIMMPVFWNILSEPNSIPENYKNIIPYPIHHLQHRSNHKIVPYLNYPWSKNAIPNTNKITEIPNNLLFIPPALPRFNFSKPQYKSKTVFEMKADLQNDIYHLYAFGKSSERVYCGIAYIPNYKTSKYMNSFFRNIKENNNLDALEESDDEEEFENQNIDKHVNLNKKLSFECTYLAKFRRWVPIKKVDAKGQIVHIRQL